MFDMTIFTNVPLLLIVIWNSIKRKLIFTSAAFGIN